MSEKPLNRLLHSKLERRFGTVRISGAGEAMSSRFIRDSITGKKKLEVGHAGEYYQVCCPRCNDTRYRLWINHRWGVKDETGRRNLWLAVCYNENCFDSYDAVRELQDELNEMTGKSIEEADIALGREVRDDEDVQIDPPGPIQPLHKLPPDHPANRYLAARFYDPERLGRFYRVGYCQSSPYTLARGRIYVPIYANGVLRGWQVRYVGELDWHSKSKDVPPKWWTYHLTRRSRLLYNLDNARRYRTGIVVEGAGDVWGLGPMGLGVFGSTVTEHQQSLFAAEFRAYNGVLLLDPTVMGTAEPRAREKLDRLCDTIATKVRGGFVPVTLPQGYDPGSLDRDYMRRYIELEARAAGVKVDWRKR